ncbi:MAG TPA: DNA polymerase IV [Candidatus Limiplasma pullicola]|nr:DNA polymerase IV [Candidatus Limiplasma pullicola]
MERVILHCDANSFYASVECLYTPSIRHSPVAVCGSVEERHGIVLTKNQIAKQFGVQTGEAIWQARQKCPDLICVPPDYALYIRFSQRMRRLYEEYSDRVESFGLDEAWIDLSNPGLTIRDGERIAHEIRLRVKRELGITVSVGVSFNKVFAKLGSDMKKPDAVTVISQDSFRDMVWPLPVGDLLFVGPATRRKLADMNVRTIGDLARFDAECLRARLGKPGLMLNAYAAGLDRSPVMRADLRRAIQSVGNSATPPHDLETPADARCLYYLLAESVAARLRQEGLRARCVSISARNTELVTRSCQQMLPRATSLTGEIAQAAMRLFDGRFSDGFPYRSAGLSCSALTPDDTPVQLDFLGDEARRIKTERLESAIDGLRRRFGHQIVRRAVTLTDGQYAQINPKEEHTVHPVPFYAG